MMRAYWQATTQVVPVFLALGLAGCGAATSGAPGAVEMVTGEITDEIALNTAMCREACDHEIACMADGDAMLAACYDECDGVWSGRDAPNAPSTRVCLARERDELRCFLGAACESLPAYFDPASTDGWPCAAEDAAAVEACEPVR